MPWAHSRSVLPAGLSCSFLRRVPWAGEKELGAISCNPPLCGGAASPIVALTWEFYLCLHVVPSNPTKTHGSSDEELFSFIRSDQCSSFASQNEGSTVRVPASEDRF